MKTLEDVWDMLVNHWPEGVPVPDDLYLSGYGDLFSGEFGFSLTGHYLDKLLESGGMLHVTAWSQDGDRHRYSGWFLIPVELRRLGGDESD